jgi:hypothetical protein
MLRVILASLLVSSAAMAEVRLFNGGSDAGIVQTLDCTGNVSCSRSGSKGTVFVDGGFGGADAGTLNLYDVMAHSVLKSRTLVTYQVDQFTATVFTGIGAAASTSSGTGGGATTVPAYGFGAMLRMDTADNTATAPDYRQMAGTGGANFMYLAWKPRMVLTAYPGGSPTSVITASRYWIALIASGDLLSFDASNAVAYMGVRYSTVAGDTTWQCCSSAGTGGAVSGCSDSGVAQTSDAAARKRFDMAYDGTTFTVAIDNVQVCSRSGATVPATSVTGYWLASVTSTGAQAVGMTRSLAIGTIQYESE